MAVPLRDLVCNVDLQSLIPKCGGCFENFDAFLRTPYILPCCHTLCLTCIAQQKQRKKRKCIICRAKYAKYTMNISFLALITQIREIAISYQRSSTFCEQCGKQTLIIDVRRCSTCEAAIKNILQHSFQAYCICMECCIEHHNGHILGRILSGRCKQPESINTSKRSLSSATMKFVRHKFKAKLTNPTSSVYSVSETLDSEPSSSSTDPQTTFCATNMSGTRQDICSEYMNFVPAHSGVNPRIAPENPGESILGDNSCTSSKENFEKKKILPARCQGRPINIII